MELRSQILEYLNDIPGASSRGIADCHEKIMAAIGRKKSPVMGTEHEKFYERNPQKIIKKFRGKP